MSEKIKVIKSKNHNGLISVDDRTLYFDADIPKGMAVDYVRIKGSFKVKGIEHTDRLLNDIECPTVINIRRELTHKCYNPERMQRDVAAVYFPEGIPEDLLEKVTNGEITDFDIYVHAEYVAEVE